MFKIIFIIGAIIVLLAIINFDLRGLISSLEWLQNIFDWFGRLF